ncbi:MAG: ParB/RepB/Spo0J family partition protein [Planctomycetia bacterium]|nr:ParB/RepB/Spo0J family partition protein [Planctomycetia bacterium]
MSRERRLGRGLEALLGRAGIEPAATAPVTEGSAAVASRPAGTGLGSGAARLILHAAEEAEEAAATLPTNDLAVAVVDPNPWQPRTVLGDADLAELADSLREHGLVQPIVVRARGDRYQLIAGQRRLAAARKLGWERVPARVLEVEDRQMAEIAIVENLQRRDLDALEKAASFKQYLATWGCTQEELAKRLSIDRSHVANLIRLLELPEAVQRKLREGKLSMGHARALLPLGDEAEQVRLADRVAAEGLSVRAVETEIQELLRRDEAEDSDDAGQADTDVEPVAGGEPVAPKRKPGRPAARRPGQVAAVEAQLRRALGVKVVVHANSRGAGRIVIPFASLDEFQRLLNHVCE